MGGYPFILATLNILLKEDEKNKNTLDTFCKKNKQAMVTQSPCTSATRVRYRHWHVRWSCGHHIRQVGLLGVLQFPPMHMTSQTQEQWSCGHKVRQGGFPKGCSQFPLEQVITRAQSLK